MGEHDEPHGTVEKLRNWTGEQEASYRRVAARLREYGVTPSVGSLGPGSGIAVGLTFRRERRPDFPLDLEASAAFSYRGYERYDLRLGLLGAGGSRTSIGPPDDPVSSQFDAFDRIERGFAVYGHLRYRRSPLNRFFGPGSDSRAIDNTSYQLSGASYELVTEYQPREQVGFAIRGGLLDFAIGRGGDSSVPSAGRLFDESRAPGITAARQPLVFHVAAAVALDGRDSAEAPRSGAMAGLLLERFDSVGSLRHDFTRVAFDARCYVPAKARSVVALRVLASGDFADRGARVPFYLQQTLGGSDTLRGFERALFRDASLLAFSAEYRFDVHRTVELAAFGDVGQVAGGFGRMSFDSFRTAIGAGVRVKIGGAVRLRADWAVGREGHRLVLAAGPSF